MVQGGVGRKFYTFTALGGAICLVDSDNEQDPALLTRIRIPLWVRCSILEGRAAFSRTRLRKNSSVMFLKVPGWETR